MTHYLQGNINSNDSSRLKSWGVEGTGTTYLSTGREALSKAEFISGENIRQEEREIKTYSGDGKLR